MGKLMDAFKSGLNNKTRQEAIYDPEENNVSAMNILNQYKDGLEGYRKLLEQAPLQQTPAYPQRNDSFEMHPVGMIAMRLHLKQGTRFPLPHIDAYIGPSCAIVFVVTNDYKPVIIEDDPGLFPSDTLITQLRLLIG